MDEKRVESLIENEKEWRRYMVTEVAAIRTRLAENEKWTFAFRILGGGLFASIIAWVGAK